MSPPRPRGGNGSSSSSSSDNSWQSWLDRNRFYVMALVGFMLVGYLMSQRGGGGGGAAPVGRRVSPGSNLPAAESSGGRVHNKGGDVKPAMGNKPAPTKVKAKNEPREDDKWLGVSLSLKKEEFFFFDFSFS